jgi:hypothetical protein
VPSLDAALAAAPAAHLVRGSLTVTVSQDLDGECAISIGVGAAPLGPPHRCASLAEVAAYLASGTVPGVQGDERDWAPVWA